MKIGLPDEAIAAMYLIKTHNVVRVIKFYPEDQTVDVIQDTFDFTNTPLGDLTIKNEFGQEITAALLEPPILYGVPVKQLRWGQFSIQACPKEGDTGYIEIFTNDITDWIENGGISIPKSDRHFAKDSCVFVPFVANKTNFTPDYVNNENTLVIKSANASITLTDDGTTSDVKIVSKTMTVTAEDGVSITGDVNIEGALETTGNITTREGDVSATVGDLKTSTASFNTHVHESAAPGSPTSGPMPAPQP